MKKFVLRKDERVPKDPEYKVPYKDLLNERQLQAVFHDRGPALVIAGAGSGKTRTLIYRVSRLVEQGVDPSRILLLTFTRRAANEMLSRASDVLDERCRRVKGGTFHFYCSSILHQYASALGFPEQFTIIDTADALQIIHYLRTRGNTHKGTKRFPNKNTLYAMISAAVNKHIDMRVVIMEQYPQFSEYLDQINQIALDYTAYKRQNDVMDFDDLLVYTRELLLNNEDIRLKVAAQHEYVLVDEYQDTNKIQSELTRLFSSVHGNVMAVGDDAQSIYSFRGADHRNILEFPELFNGTSVIKLEENYRSTPEILDVANALLDQATHKFDKHLFTSNEKGEKPALVKAGTQNDQSRFITQVVLQLREQELPLNEMAVLFRNGRDSYELEVELNRSNVPFVKYGGQKFTEAAHIKDVLAHLRVLVNPMDTIAWNRILMLIDGIGPKTAEELFQWIRSAQDPYKLQDAGAISSSYMNQIKALSSMLVSIRDEELSVSETVEKVVEYYRVFCEKRYDDYPKRLKDLEAFVNLTVNYSSLAKMLEEMALDPITASVVDTEQTLQEEAPLVLSTIHSAKGLEWEHVFLMNCLDGIIPSSYAVEDEEQLDEELRLLYVATTRARKMLYVSYPSVAQSGYGDYFTKVSRFIEPLERKEMEEWLLVEESEDQALPPADPLLNSAQTD